MNMGHVLNNPASSVTLGDSIDDFGESKVFPFWYSFVNNENDDYVDGTSAVDAFLGITIPAATARAVHFIKMDPDYPFKLLALKYSAYFNNAGSMEWYNNEALWTGQLELGDYQTIIGTPLTDFIRISVIAQGSDGRYLYGGKNLNIPVVGGGDELRLPVDVLQGYDYGEGSVYIPYLLPREGGLELRLSNTHATKDITVTGAAFGHKLRV